MSPLASAWREYREAARSFSRPARLFLLSTVIAWTGFGANQVLFNLYLVEGGFRESFVGRTLSMTGLGLALAALPAGWLADRWGRWRCVVAGIGIDALAIGARALTIEPGVVLATSFAIGLGQALFAIAAAPFLTEHSGPRERTHLFSAFFSLELLAIVAGSLLGGTLPHGLERLFPGLDRFHAYRWTLLLGALIELIGVLPLLALAGLREERVRTEHVPGDPSAARLLTPVAGFAFLIGCGAGLVIPFMNLYFKSRFNCSSAQIGVFFSLAQVSTALAALFGPPLARRYGRLRTAMASQFLSLPFLLTLGFERRLEVAVAAFWLRATFMQASMPLLNTFLMETMPPGLRARSTSLMNLVWNAGWAVSATLSGMLIQSFGYAVPFSVTAVLYLAATLSFWLSFRHVKETAPMAGDGESLVTEEVKGARGQAPSAE